MEWASLEQNIVILLTNSYWFSLAKNYVLNNIGFRFEKECCELFIFYRRIIKMESRDYEEQCQGHAPSPLPNYAPVSMLLNFFLSKE